MRRMKQGTLYLILAAAAGLLSLALLGSPAATATPYESGLAALPESSAVAKAACENKRCASLGDNTNSKCVDEAGSNCVTVTFHGRGHGSSCSNQAC